MQEKVEEILEGQHRSEAKQQFPAVVHELWADSPTLKITEVLEKTKEQSRGLGRMLSPFDRNIIMLLMEPHPSTVHAD